MGGALVFRELTLFSVVVRCLAAVLLGGVIGLERGLKNRAAGFRTYMLVCLGAALTMLIGQYNYTMLHSAWEELAQALGVQTDVSRLGAQVINGVGFLGAGTIIVTGRQQIKGLTTAAGLWASACMGLAIGAGFYLGALVGCLLIIVTTGLLSFLEVRIMSTARNMNIYIEFLNTDDIGRVIESVKKLDVKIYDIEITRIRSSDGLPPSAILTLRLPKKLRHADLMAAIASVNGVQSVEEL